MTGRASVLPDHVSAQAREADGRQVDRGYRGGPLGHGAHPASQEEGPDEGALEALALVSRRPYPRPRRVRTGAPHPPVASRSRERGLASRRMTVEIHNKGI